MSKNNNISTMYKKELNELKDSIIESIKFFALESGLNSIEIGTHIKLEVKYSTVNNECTVESLMIIESNCVTYSIERFEVKELIEILTRLEEKNYTILS